MHASLHGSFTCCVNDQTRKRFVFGRLMDDFATVVRSWSVDLLRTALGHVDRDFHCFIRQLKFRDFFNLVFADSSMCDNSSIRPALVDRNLICTRKPTHSEVFSMLHVSLVYSLAVCPPLRSAQDQVFPHFPLDSWADWRSSSLEAQ